MSDFKVGDRVRIREDLSTEDKVYGYILDEEMLKYKGQEAIIKKIWDGHYTIDIDNREWAWVEEMFESKDLHKIKELEQRIEKLEKCVMGEQNSLEKSENVSFMNKLTKGNIEDLKYWREIGYKWTCKDEKGSIHIFKIKPTIYNIEELLKGECEE